MSDPNHDGPYECHGTMTPITLKDVDDGVSAYLCETCQKFRHRFPRTDPKRQMVNERMPLLLMAMAADSQ